MKKKIPKKITLDNLEKSAIKYLEKYSATEYQLTTTLRRKIIKTSFFYKTKPEKDFEFIKLIINKFKKIGLIDDKKFSQNKALVYMEQARRLKPKMAKIYLLLARSYELVDKKKSINYYLRFKKMARTDPDFLNIVQDVQRKISELKKDQVFAPAESESSLSKIVPDSKYSASIKELYAFRSPLFVILVFIASVDIPKTLAA